MNNYYNDIKSSLVKGWNTWNVHSVLSHVLLPEGLSVNLGIKEYSEGNFLRNALIGRIAQNGEKIHPGAHAYDGSYTELSLKWNGIELVVQSAVKDDDIFLLIRPVASPIHTPVLTVDAGILWNREGYVLLEDGVLKGIFKNRIIDIYFTQSPINESYIPLSAPYVAFKLDKVVGISTGRKLTVNQITSVIEEKKKEHSSKRERYGELAEVYNAMQTCMAWDTIYDPGKDRVITPVSRLWCNNGYVLFCWDTYFAAYMAAADNKELAYANVIEITREKTDEGFVPNFAKDNGFKSKDRSQPPVGSMVVKALYEKYKDIWLLEELFDDLYKWNTWFYQNRQIERGLMAWGSNPYSPVTGNYWEYNGVDDRFGAALESGLDNSPMYDDIPFNKQKHCMELADVGLMGLYSMDCEALSYISQILGKMREAKELSNRIEVINKGLNSLWNEQKGMFFNRRTDTGEFNYRLSPTNFYAAFNESVSEEKVNRIIKEYFYNENEFWGEWIMPSVSKNDPAYGDQCYWRGRIWAPMNFLVYLAFRKRNMKNACSDLADKSVKLILKEWLEQGHVHENYSADTGEGCDRHDSDRFYHWGGLLSLIALIESGLF